METYRCKACDETFETEGDIWEYTDPIYGPCWKRVARCPSCGAECDEEVHKRRSKGFDFDSYVEDLRSQGGSCMPGGGCCG